MDAERGWLDPTGTLRQVRFADQPYTAYEYDQTTDLPGVCFSDWTYARALDDVLSDGDLVIVREFSKPLETADLALRLSEERPEDVLARVRTAELGELIASGLIVTRYRGRATAAGMAMDLVGRSDAHPEAVSGQFRQTCEITLTPEQARGLGLAGYPLLALLVAGVLADLRRRRAAARLTPEPGGRPRPSGRSAAASRSAAPGRRRPSAAAIRGGAASAPSARSTTPPAPRRTAPGGSAPP